MLKMWKNDAGRIFAECDACGSYGTARVELKRQMDKEIEDALERHATNMAALRSAFTHVQQDVARQIKNGTMKRADGVAKVRALWLDHVAKVRLAEVALPDPAGRVRYVVDHCPWCGAKEDAAIEALPEGKVVPDYSLAAKNEAARKGATR